MKLTLDAVCVRYPDGTALGPWSFRFGPGLYHLQGPNGTGKSSLLGAVATALPRASGRVDLDGVDPEFEHDARARIGYLSAQPSMPGFLTVRETWRMAATLRGRPDWDGAALESALNLPPDLRLAQCSSGMRQKAELIAALAADPALLVLDEPLANLDTDSAGWVRQRLASHTSIALVAHHGDLPGAKAVQL